MNIIKAKVVIFCLISLVFANNTVFLNGTVVDELNNPLKGALVTLGQLTDSTDSLGSFYFSAQSSIKGPFKFLDHEEFVFRGNYLIANLISPKQISVSQFDLCGRLVRFSNPGLIPAGNHNLRIPLGKKDGVASTVTILRVVVGSRALFFRNVNGVVTPQYAIPSKNKSGSLFKRTKSTGKDSLVVAKDGYITRTVHFSQSLTTLPPITLYSSTNMRQIYILGPFLHKGMVVATASIRKNGSTDSLFYPLSWDTLGLFGGTVFASKHDSSMISITIADSSGLRLGLINSYIDSLQDSCVFKLRPVFINGTFGPGDTGAITACTWKDSTPDSFSYPLAWTDTGGSGKYSGVVYCPAHSGANIRITIRGGSDIRLGTSLGAIDSSLDSATINCISSIPIVNVGPDTALAWGDTIRLRASAVDSVDKIVKYEWNFNGNPIIELATLKDTSIIAPSFLADSIYPFVFNVTDSDGNTVTKALQVHMTCSVKNYRMKDMDAPEWVQVGNFTVYKPGEFAGILDTGTLNFGGIDEVAVQNMKQIGTRTLTVKILDAGTAVAARSLFAMKKSTIPSSVIKVMPSYPDSTVIIDNGPPEGIIVYAHFKSFFFQLTFDGFISGYDIVLLNAEKFMAIYEQRALKTSMCRNE